MDLGGAGYSIHWGVVQSSAANLVVVALMVTVHVFGVLTLSSLAVVVLTGCALALRCPVWWHVSDAGRYVDSLHLWNVELFMFVSMGAAFTGCLVQQNFDTQWIAGQAEDGLNSVGAVPGSTSSTSARCAWGTRCCCPRPWLCRRRGIQLVPADAPEPPAVTTAPATWHTTSTARQRQRAGACADALGKARGGEPGRVQPGDCGPVPTLTARPLELAPVGGLDGRLRAAPTRRTTPGRWSSSATARTWRTGPAPGTWPVTSGG
ncbi:hypothetical protein ABZT08_22030 [Streptomyces sp. NPDC005526]|uniref:hypothetical protein n=1 Tax=Streptomyces sp. NPDC005526 TaxID=3156885 RepID=UPI0033A4BD0F